MSEPRLWKITATYGPDDDPMMWEEATVDEVLFAVRRAVESGTIDGAYVWDTDDWTQQEQYKFDEGKWLVIPIRGGET